MSMGIFWRTNMEAALWNRIRIPRPGAISTVHIPFNASTNSQVTHLLKSCENVLKLLGSKVLQTEVRVLYALLYVLNNGHRQHRPFRAIKQVEQCINRLKDMKLESILQDLRDMCPKKVQRLAGKRTGQCEVPSQPILEWMCLKVLGACKLMICLAERCSRAFQLAGQHLHWGEFIVLNVVLMSMLSRLRAFSHGIIRTLAAVYEKMLALLQEVSRAKPMPFLTDSALPADLDAFLGSVAELKGGLCADKGTRRPAMLNRLFRERGKDRKRKQPRLHRKSSRGTDRVDLGSVVSQSRAEVTDHLGGFDLKAMLKRPYGKSYQFDFDIPCELEMPKKKRASQELAVIGQKQSFLKKSKAVSSLSDMDAHLQEMIDWFRSRKMRRESSRLRLLQLKCQRLNWLDVQGLRVNRKLQRLRGEMSRALYPDETQRTERFLVLQSYRSARCHSLHSQWRRLHSRALSRSNGKRSYKRARGVGGSQMLAGGGLSSEEETGGGGDVTTEDTARDTKSHPTTSIRPCVVPWLQTTTEVVYPQEKKSLFLDPMGESLENTKRYLETRAFMRQKGCNVSRWSCDSLPHGLQQHTSCGIFALKFPEKVLEGEALDTKVSLGAVNKWRLEVATTLLQESVQSAAVFLMRSWSFTLIYSVFQLVVGGCGQRRSLSGVQEALLPRTGEVGMTAAESASKEKREQAQENGHGGVGALSAPWDRWCGAEGSGSTFQEHV
ncbi:hypothetical protein SKAU_G00253110 [Synaphobranchus kaupii]|uniref:Nucleolus and neural progenitor protein-like N-terminal domain-containing protein n=1 Tax=Synaphobranchus kaupii TaxID=118154 RepID=A0A9Q1IR50_SYNKA|nr:hypothetical protein SKAU_G00253110 [Synaphobranchus kaupii]